MNNNSFHLIIYVYWGTFICLFILLFVQTSAEGSCRFFPTSFAVFILHWRWVSWRIRASKKKRKVRTTISIPYWTRYYCPVSSNVEEIKNTPFLKFFKFCLRRLEKQLELNFSLRARSLWARDSTRILLKESGNTLALWGLLGWGTAPWNQLKESGIPLALWGGEVGDSTRYSTKGIRNRASSPGCPGGGGQHPGFC